MDKKEEDSVGIGSKNLGISRNPLLFLFSNLIRKLLPAELLF